MLYPKVSSPLSCHCGEKLDCSSLRDTAATLDGWFELVRKVAFTQGFQPIFPSIPAHKVIWLCAKCRTRAAEKVIELAEIVGIEGDFVGSVMGTPIPVSQFVLLGQLYDWKRS